jgi:hypothetical protein
MCMIVPASAVTALHNTNSRVRTYIDAQMYIFYLYLHTRAPASLSHPAPCASSNRLIFLQFPLHTCSEWSQVHHQDATPKGRSTQHTKSQGADPSPLLLHVWFHRSRKLSRVKGRRRHSAELCWAHLLRGPWRLGPRLGFCLSFISPPRRANPKP